MRFDPTTGSIEFPCGLVLRRGMTRQQILSSNTKWEDWTVIEGVPHAFRALIDLPNKGLSSKTILIAHVGTDTSPLAFWDIAPWDIADGAQNRPEGKYTKRMRLWFQETFGEILPLGGDWGNIDASYDPWNQSTGVICNYRERFATNKDWLEYRCRNKF
jgi:hypothetical protein